MLRESTGSRGGNRTKLGCEKEVGRGARKLTKTKHKQNSEDRKSLAGRDEKSAIPQLMEAKDFFLKEKVEGEGAGVYFYLNIQ